MRRLLTFAALLTVTACAGNDTLTSPTPVTETAREGSSATGGGTPAATVDPIATQSPDVIWVRPIDGWHGKCYSTATMPLELGIGVSRDNRDDLRFRAEMLYSKKAAPEGQCATVKLPQDGGDGQLNTLGVSVDSIPAFQGGNVFVALRRYIQESKDFQCGGRGEIHFMVNSTMYWTLVNTGRDCAPTVPPTVPPVTPNPPVVVSCPTNPAELAAFQPFVGEPKVTFDPSNKVRAEFTIKPGYFINVAVAAYVKNENGDFVPQYLNDGSQRNLGEGSHVLVASFDPTLRPYLHVGKVRLRQGDMFKCLDRQLGDILTGQDMAYYTAHLAGPASYVYDK